MILKLSYITIKGELFMKSSIYKVITGVIAVLGFIGGIILGNTVKVHGIS